MSRPPGEEHERIRQKRLDAIERRLLELGVTPEEWQQSSRNFMYEFLWGEPPPCDIPESWAE